MAALGDLLGDVAHFEQRRLRLCHGDKSADTLDAGEDPSMRQLAQRPVDRHAADAECLHQFGLGGNAVARIASCRP